MRNKLTAIIGTLAICLSMLPSSIMAYWTNGYEVIVNGDSIGLVESDLAVTSMLAVVNHELTSGYGDDALINPDIQLRAKFITSGKLMTKEELHDSIASVSERMTDAVRISVDGADSICVKDMEDAESSIQLVIDTLGEEHGNSNIVELIGYSQTLAPECNIITAEEASEHFIEEDMLTVFTEVIEETTEKYVPIPTEYEDANLYEGVKVTTSNGTNGTTKVLTTNSYVNGKLTGTMVEKEVIDHGTPASVAVGTKPRPAGVGTGTFIMPTKGRISSGFGSRWGRVHKGIDIASDTGNPVYASDDGIVSLSEFTSSFGNLVIIDHGNGFETYYAHNSELLVSEGEAVKKGQQIAKIGSTGRSTGPHCHFEIRYNGVPKNPMNYIK